MNRAVKRFISVSLVLSLVIGLLPVPPFGETIHAVGIFSDAPFCIPTDGKVFQLYSSSHNGIDIGVGGQGKGPAVYAPYSGKIVYVGRGFASENLRPDIYPLHMVGINHGLVNGKHTVSLLAHLGTNGDPSRKIAPVSFINPGILDGSITRVSMGALIGYQGTAGLASGTHIHYIIRVKQSSTPFTSGNLWSTGSYTDPVTYVFGSTSVGVGTQVVGNCNGTLIRPRGGTSIYFLENGKRRWVPDPPTLHALFPNLAVQNLDPATVNAFPRGPNIPSIFSGYYLLRAKGSAGVYFIDHGKRRLIPDPPTLHALFPNKPLLDIDSAVLSSIPRGPNIPSIFTGPYLLRAKGTTGIYFVENGQRRWVPDPDTLRLVFPGMAVLNINSSDLNRIPQGANIPSVHSVWIVGIAPLAGAWEVNNWFNTDVSLVVSGASPYGITKIAWQFEPREDGDWKFLPASGDAATLPPITEDGIYKIRYNVSNRYGFWASEEVVTVKIDKTFPFTELSYDGPSYQDEGGKLFVSPETPFSLEAEDELSGVEDSFYDYGGGSEIFEEPFSLPKELGDGRLNIRYHSTDVAGNVELENSQEVYLDSTPPNSSDNSDGGWHNEDVVVTITADDGEGAGVQAIYYWINDDQEEVAEGDQVLVLFEDEGAYELSYYAVDNVENVEGEIHLALVKIDKTPPTIEGFRNHEPNKYGWYNEDVVVHFVAEDQPDLSGLNSESVTPDITISTEGKDQEVTGVAEDNAGNTASVTVGGINIDKADPNSEITFPEEGEYYNAESWEGEVQGIAHDNLSGIESVEVEIVGREAGDAQLEDYGKLETGWEYSLEFAEDGSDDGYYTIHSSATDLAGNQELIQESTNEVAFVFDNTPPTSEIVDVEDHHYINGRGLDEGVNLEFTAEDNIALQNARLYKRYEGGEWDYHSSTKRELGTKAEGVFTVKTLHLSEDSYKDPNREGLWEFSSSAKDKAQNCENQENCRGPLEVEEPDTWIIYDITPPTSAIASLEEGAYYNAESWPGIAGAASDATPKGSEITTSGVAQVEVQVLRDGAVVVDWTTADGIEGWTFEGFPFEDGVYLVSSRATDRAGNQEETFEISFTYDDTAPVSTITSVEEGAYYNAATWPGIFGEAGDNLSGVAQVEVRIDKDGEEGEWFAWEDVEGWSQWTVPGFIPSDGFYTVYSRATDKANNTESTFFVSFVYDNTPPAAPIASIPGGTFIEGEILRINLTAEEGAAIYYSLNGSEPLPYSGAIVINDDATLSAYAIDQAGNRSASVEFSYVFSAEGGSASGGNLIPQVLGAEIPNPKGSDSDTPDIVEIPTPKGLENWALFLGVVLLGGVPYLFLRRRIFSGR